MGTLRFSWRLSPSYRFDGNILDFSVKLSRCCYISPIFIVFFSIGPFGDCQFGFYIFVLTGISIFFVSEETFYIIISFDAIIYFTNSQFHISVRNGFVVLQK